MLKVRSGSMRFVSLLIAFLLVNVSLINAYNMSETHIYKGRYTNTSDLLMSFDGMVPVVVFLVGM